MSKKSHIALLATAPLLNPWRVTRGANGVEPVRCSVMSVISARIKLARYVLRTRCRPNAG